MIVAGRYAAVAPAAEGIAKCEGKGTAGSSDGPVTRGGAHDGIARQFVGLRDTVAFWRRQVGGMGSQTTQPGNNASAPWSTEKVFLVLSIWLLTFFATPFRPASRGSHAAVRRSARAGLLQGWRQVF